MALSKLTANRKDLNAGIGAMEHRHYATVGPLKMFNEDAAGEYLSHQGQRIRDARDAARDAALSALRDGRFEDFDAAVALAASLGCTEDLEAWASNIVSKEIDNGKGA